MTETSFGGNYVDVSLRVVVHGATDTLMVSTSHYLVYPTNHTGQAIRPEYKHGTTQSRPGTLRKGVAVNFSTHIKAAYDRAVEAGGFVLEEPEGNGSV